MEELFFKNHKIAKLKQEKHLNSHLSIEELNLLLKLFSQMTTTAYLPLKSTSKRTECMKQQFIRHLTSARRTLIAGKCKRNIMSPTITQVYSL